MLTGARVTSAFRGALFDAANRAGVSVNEFVLLAAAEKLRAGGVAFAGLFYAGDLPDLQVPGNDNGQLKNNQSEFKAARRASGSLR